MGDSQDASADMPGAEYAGQAMNRERFITTSARLAAEVYDFHHRWALESGAPVDVMRRRAPMLDEEVRELREEVDRPEPDFDETAMSEEAADVLFVALGHMEQLGAAGLAGMEAVTAKNIAKTTKSHFLHPDTGKVTRRNRPEPSLLETREDRETRDGSQGGPA